MRFRLLHCLARSIAKNGVKFVCKLVPAGAALSEIAADAWENYCRDQREDAFRGEVQALAQASPDQVRQEVKAAVQAGAAGQPAEIQKAITAYLCQVPAAIRRSLRRPSDPTGTTVQASRSFSCPEDLVPLLPARPPRFQPGARPLAGLDWVLEEMVGIGGFGEVWKARHAHMRSKPPVALKFCLDAAAVPALRNEAGVLDQVMKHGRHPGIVALLDTHLSADPPCLQYEYVEGGDLAALIRELRAGRKLTIARANRLFVQLVDIVASAHGAKPPIVHDDLKLSNVLVRRRDGGELELRVTDFGIGGVATEQAVRESRQPTRSRQELLTEAVRGAYTPLYASPEQMTRKRGERADLRDDIHALGVIWYQLLTGDLEMLTVPTDWREQVQKRGLKGGLVELLATCIAPKAETRPPSAVALRENLAELLPGVASDPVPSDSPDTPSPAAQSGPGNVIGRMVRANPVSAVCVMLAVLAISIALLRAFRGSSDRDEDESKITNRRTASSDASGFTRVPLEIPKAEIDQVVEMELTVLAPATVMTAREKHISRDGKTFITVVYNVAITEFKQRQERFPLTNEVSLQLYKTPFSEPPYLLLMETGSDPKARRMEFCRAAPVLRIVPSEMKKSGPPKEGERDTQPAPPSPP